MFIFIGMYTFKEDMFYSSEYRTLAVAPSQTTVAAARMS